MIIKISSKKILLFTLVGLAILGFLILPNLHNKALSADSSKVLPEFTPSQLEAYNGDDSTKPVYIGLDGNVYDVSAGRKDFYNPGKSYHYLAGRDSTEALNLFGGGLIKTKYPIVGRLKQP